MKGPGLCLGDGGNESQGWDTLAPPSTEPCPCPTLLQNRAKALGGPGELCKYLHMPL